VTTVADALSRLDIDSLKIQEETEEVLTLLSGSETTASAISNENPNAYCLDLQRASKSQGKELKRKVLSPISLFNTAY
jgi:hypothetical protein